MTEYKVSFRYARAVLELAEQENISESIYKDLEFVEKTLESSIQLKVFTINPIIQEWRKVRVYKEFHLSPCIVCFLSLKKEEKI